MLAGFVLGFAAFPVGYFALYVLLRVCGVYYPFYNQSGWDIDGSTGVETIDIAFFPAQAWESYLQNYLHWLPEPSGG